MLGNHPAICTFTLEAIGKDRLALGLERRIAGNRDADGLVRIDLARAVTERAHDIERHLAGMALRIVHAKKPDELVGGDAVGVLAPE